MKVSRFEFKGFKYQKHGTYYRRKENPKPYEPSLIRLQVVGDEVKVEYYVNGHLDDVCTEYHTIKEYQEICNKVYSNV